MDDRLVLGDMDLISVADVRSLTSVEGPCVSAFLPTHRHGPDTGQAPVRLRNLTDGAARSLAAGDVDPRLVDQVLSPLRELVDDVAFWQHQADGLAVFSAPGSFASYRLPRSFDEEVTVGPSFRIRPLLPLLDGDGAFFVLALSQGSVRLLRGTRHTIGDVGLGPIPRSMGEALAHEDRETELQFRSGGGEGALFHGHGAGDEVDKAALERFFRAVDRGLVERLGAADAPLVLACVGYYAPLYRSVSRYPTIVDGAVEGSPERLAPAELHEAAWALVGDRFGEQARRDLERYREAAGTGRAVTAIDELAQRAHEGRVDTLLVDEGPPVWVRLDLGSATVRLSTTAEPAIDDVDLVDLAALDTLATGGRVVSAVEPLGHGHVTAALLRY